MRYSLSSLASVCCVVCSASLFITGCSSSSKESNSYVKQEVIANSDRTLKTPPWVLSSQMMTDENGRVAFVYKMDVDGQTRTDACVSMAGTQALGEMTKYIQTAVTTSGQVEQLNAASDPAMSGLTAFLSQGKLSGAQVSETYWEQVMMPDVSGVHAVKRLLCAVKVTIDRSTLQQQLQAATTGQPGGNPQVRKALLDAQTQFLADLPQTGATATAPSSMPPLTHSQSVTPFSASSPMTTPVPAAH